MLPSGTQPIEYGQSRLFREWRQITRGADTGGASFFACAGGDQVARLVHQQFMHAEERFGKSDAAWVCVEQIQIRLEKLLRVWASDFFHARRGKVIGGGRIRRAFADRRAQVPAVAHKQECRDGFESMQ